MSELGGTGLCGAGTGTSDGVSVMVFAPAPLLTVTIEQQAQKTQLHLHPGGQGVWQARMIAALGAPVTLCVSVGGETGTVLERPMQDDAGVTVRTVTRDADTGWYVHDRRDGERTAVAEDAGAPLAIGPDGPVTERPIRGRG